MLLRIAAEFAAESSVNNVVSSSAKYNSESYPQNVLSPPRINVVCAREGKASKAKNKATAGKRIRLTLCGFDKYKRRRDESPPFARKTFARFV